MPITAEDLARGATTQLQFYSRNDPVDLINTERPLLKWFVSHKKDAPAGNFFLNETLRTGNDGNYQNYAGPDQVTYNNRDTNKQAQFPMYSAHDGFYIDEHEAARNGITLTDSGESNVSDAEKIQIVNLLKERFQNLKDSMQQGLDIESHLDGSQSTKAAPGLDALVSTTPTVGVVGGIDRAVATYFRNQANTGIVVANLIDQMEITYRAATKFGKQRPTKFFCGGDFLDAYRKQAGQTINRQIDVAGNEKGGVSLDAGTTRTYFKGIELEWDPVMDDLDAMFGAPPVPWSKRCYMLSPETIKLRPVTGRWMIDRKPNRPHDRYIHFWGRTADYRFVITNPRANAVLSIA